MLQSVIAYASPLLLTSPASSNASIIGRPSPARCSRGNFLLGTSAKMPASWASVRSAISAPKKISVARSAVVSPSGP